MMAILSWPPCVRIEPNLLNIFPINKTISKMTSAWISYLWYAFFFLNFPRDKGLKKVHIETGHSHGLHCNTGVSICDVWVGHVKLQYVSLIEKSGWKTKKLYVLWDKSMTRLVWKTFKNIHILYVEYLSDNMCHLVSYGCVHHQTTTWPVYS